MHQSFAETKVNFVFPFLLVNIALLEGMKVLLLASERGSV
jgi:hypothetical protein